MRATTLASLLAVVALSLVARRAAGREGAADVPGAVVQPGHEAELVRLLGPEPLDGGWTARGVQVRDVEVRVTLGLDDLRSEVVLSWPDDGAEPRSAHFAIRVTPPPSLSPGAASRLVSAVVNRVRERDTFDAWSLAGRPTPADFGRPRAIAWGVAAALLLGLGAQVLRRLRTRRGKSWLFDLPGTDAPGPGGALPPAEKGVLFALVAGCVALEAWHGLVRLGALGGSYDLGLFATAFWNAAHGQGFFNLNEGVDHQGVHAAPLLWLLVPAYRLLPDPSVLVVSSAVAMGLALVPAYLIARRREGPLFALGCVAVLAAQRSFAIAGQDFHEDSLALPLLFATLWFLEVRRPVPFLVSMGLALSCKEGIGLWVLALGACLAFDRATRFAASLVAAVGLLWLVVAIGILMPIHGAGEAWNPVLGFSYSNLGAGWEDWVLSPVARPREFWGRLLGDDARRYAGAILLPFAMLPLLAPRALILALPFVLQNLLSSRAQMRSLAYQYDGLLLPGLYLAFVVGGQRLADLAAGRFGRRAGLAAGVVVVLAGLAMAMAFNDGEAVWSLPDRVNPDRVAAAREAIAQVPPDLPVTVPNGLLPWVADRVFAGSYCRPADLLARFPKTAVLVVQGPSEVPDPIPADHPGLGGYETTFQNDWFAVRVRKAGAPVTAPAAREDGRSP